MINKETALKILNDFKAKIDPIASNKNLIEALELAVAEIGICHKCEGRQVIPQESIIGPGYKVRTDHRGRKTYLYPCLNCNGTGKRTRGSCESCGKEFVVLVAAKTSTHCATCEGRLARLGVI